MSSEFCLYHRTCGTKPVWNKNTNRDPCPGVIIATFLSLPSAEESEKAGKLILKVDESREVHAMEKAFKEFIYGNKCYPRRLLSEEVSVIYDVPWGAILWNNADAPSSLAFVPLCMKVPHTVSMLGFTKIDAPQHKRLCRLKINCFSTILGIMASRKLLSPRCWEV